ncbi:MAG TPA: hypothetical protein VF980_09710 [Thermoanaerobaculia bacterium]
MPLRADGATSQSLPIFHVGGFGDIEAHTHSSSRREDLNAAELDVFATLQLSNSWSALADAVALKSWNTRADEKSVEIELERLYVEYSTSDAFRLELGETETGIVRWSAREHRSRFLQTPVDVPAIARRPAEDGAWPLRFIGARGSGRMSGPLGLTWAAGAGVGPGPVREAVPVFGGGRSPAALLLLSSSPESIPGFDTGAAVYAQEVHSRPDRIRERDVTLWVNYVSHGDEMRIEWARMNHSLTSNPAMFVTTGYYALLSKRLSGRAEHARPYVLLDRLRVARGESYLGEAADENAWAAGLRYDVTQRFNVKTELRSQRSVAGHRESVLGLELGTSF